VVGEFIYSPIILGERLSKDLLAFLSATTNRFGDEVLLSLTTSYCAFEKQRSLRNLRPGNREAVLFARFSRFCLATRKKGISTVPFLTSPNNLYLQHFKPIFI
jgi:hypothetical protein